jgi:hypothetical protein
MLSRAVLSDNSAQIGGYSSFLPLDIWGAFDSAWYIGIANHGYSTAVNELNQANYAFFPLYPALIALFRLLVGDSYVAGLIISNVSLIMGSLCFYKLVRLDYEKDVALRAIKYLFLFPVAFIFSSAFTESLYFSLVIICFYCLRKRQWFVASYLGFLLVLTKALGALVVLSLVYEHLRNKGINTASLGKSLVICTLPALGLALFAGHIYQLTGDIMAIFHIRASWGGELVNPLEVLMVGMTQMDVRVLLPSWIAAISLVLVFKYARQIHYSYVFFAVYSILVPLATDHFFSSVLRYLSVVFPLYIILGLLTHNNRRFDLAATIFLFLLQSTLMISWSNWLYVVT